MPNTEKLEDTLMTEASQVKKTLATLKGSQSILRVYAAQTRNEETREVYDQAIGTTQTVINEIEERVQDPEFQEPQYKGN